MEKNLFLTRLIFSIFVIIGLFFAVGLPHLSLATVTLQNPIPNTNFDLLVKNAISSILGLSGILALFAFIYGGIYWLISMGDTNKITKGKNIMLWAVAGLAIIFGSYAIITTVYNVLGIK